MSQMIFRDRPVRALIGALALTGLFAHFPVAQAAQAWIKDELTLDGEAQIYLSAEFSQIKGKFRAQPESILDTMDKIDGTFIVGKYRYAYKRPTADASGKLVDEMISTEILDCQRQFYGTLKQQWLRNGKSVAEKNTALADVSMIQTHGANLGSKLCDLYAHKPAAPLERRAVSNPSYKPQPSAKDVDALIDKYSPPKKGIDK
jgi:hypothetical protein